MNIFHLKYAIEIAKCGSINKAAESLMMNQPNLSRSLKELETQLGVKLFVRSPKGMVATPDGETFLRYAKSILKQVDEVENVFKDTLTQKKRFSISVPRTSYISDAFTNFSLHLKDEPAIEIFYTETNSKRAIKNILESDYRLGILRYASTFDRYYKNLLNEKGLTYQLVTEFKYSLVLSRDNPLAEKEKITYEDLQNCIEIAHADPFVPSLSFAEVKKEELPDNINRRIYVFERASQFELLSKNPATFMWVSPIPADFLERHNLVQRTCEENKKIYRDVLIHRKDYQMTELDNLFVSELKKSRQKVF